MIFTDQRLVPAVLPNRSADAAVDRVGLEGRSGPGARVSMGLGDGRSGQRRGIPAPIAAIPRPSVGQTAIPARKADFDGVFTFRQLHWA